MIAAHLDLETRSTCELKTAGLHRYFEDPETDVLIVRWRIGDGAVGTIADIQPFLDHIAAGGMVVGHNIAFDREGWNTKIAPLMGWPPIPVEQTDCTMARCAAIAVPQGLDQATKALNLSITKDAEGHRLMLRMCKPRKRHDDGTVEWHETPEQLDRLSAYCEQDVLAECEVDRVVPALNATERRVWVLDQHINARGVQLDTALVDKALAVAELATFAASIAVFDLTDGVVQRTTETAKIVKWLNGRGVPALSIAKAEVDEILLRTDLFDDAIARQVVELRRATAKSSLAKYKAMQRSVCRDGRVRGTLNYHGAGTGRWAGRLIQPQNFPRIGEYADDVEQLHAILRGKSAKAAFELCTLYWENPLEILSRALRSMVIAASGKVLIGGDYSNIEGRVNAWLAGEDWKVQAFADFDQGVGWDLYVLAYARAFDLDPSAVDKAMRQSGKVMELALGFQGGVRAFQKMAANYGMNVSDERADDLKVAWREAHPAIVKSWKDLQYAAIEAVRHPGMKVPCLQGRIQYLVKHGILWCRLPSGRALSYVAPRIVSQVFVDEDGVEVVTDRPQVEFSGQNSMTKKWERQRLYGGLQCENVVQAIARDVLVEGMFRLEDAGYPLVLTVHDENITEVPEGFGSPEELAALMSVVPVWAEGLPVAVNPWKDHRYVK
jgi:DNA polymerase